MFNEGFTSLALISILIPITWLMTKRYKPSLIATNFAKLNQSTNFLERKSGLGGANFFKPIHKLLFI